MEAKQSRNIWYLFGVLGMILLVLLDQLSKKVVVSDLKGEDDVILIKNVLQLHYLENTGAAFGIFQNQQWLFIVIALIFLVVAVWLFVRMPKTWRYVPLAILAVLIASGAIGNVIDRIRLGYVVDFIYFSLINFPVFNVADMYVTVGAILLIIAILFFYKDDEFNFLIPGSKKQDEE